MMPSSLRRGFQGLAVAGALTLSACGGVGDGIEPVKSALLPLGGVEGAASTKAYTCLNTSVQLVVTFSNGARGDFSSRAVWSSSNPSVAKVSNADLPVPEQEGVFYGRGVVVPAAPGTTTITAKYLDFRSSIQVVVADPTNVRIIPAEADVAVGALSDLAISADLDGITSAVDTLATWSFVTANDAVATIASTTGIITGVAEGGPLTAKVSIPGCTAAVFSDVTAPVNVSPLNSLTLTKEFTDRSQLLVGTTERITATGTLVNGKTQDLSGQVTFTSSDSASLLFLAGSLRNLVFAAKAATSPVQLKASYSYTISDGDDTTEDPTSTPVESNELPITPLDGTLTKVTVSPVTSDIAPGATLALKATGEYTTTATIPTQDITRHVTWTSADTSLVTVQNNGGVVNPLAGVAQASSAAEAGKTVVITAANANATTQTSATSTLTIQPATSP